MQFSPKSSIYKILESYGTRHELTQASVWVPTTPTTTSFNLYIRWPAKQASATLNLNEEIVLLASGQEVVNPETSTEVHGFYTPLIDHTKLVGILYTERKQVVYANDNDEETDPKRVRAVASELISAILVYSPLWGVESSTRSTADFPFPLEESRRKFMDFFEEFRKKPQRMYCPEEV